MKPVAPFSVVIPLYNKGDLVSEAIRSVLAGNVLPKEIIVVDDGSTDDSAAHAEALGEPCVRVVRQANGGVSSARNRGIKESTSEFIAFLDADDLWEPEHMQALQALTQRFPHAALFATGFYQFHPDGNRSNPRIRNVPLDCGPQLVERFYDVWPRGNFFFTSGVAIARRFLERHDLSFPHGEKLGEDQDLWFRVAELGSVAYDPRPTVGYRLAVADSLSQAKLPLEPLPYIQRLEKRFMEGRIPPIHRRDVSRFLACTRIDRAHRYAKQGHFAPAFRLLISGFNLHALGFWLRNLVRIVWVCCFRYARG